MLTTLLSQYTRTIIVVSLLVVLAVLEIFEVRISIYNEIYPFFEWMQYSFWFGVLGTTYGSVYATVEAFHLLTMAVLGGAVLTADLRLLGVIFKDIPSETIVQGTHKVFKTSLALAILTGVFCAAGVGTKVYYLEVFWYKMLALVAGACFVFFIKHPVLSRPHNELNPWTIRLLAVSSVLVWFTVAACGRWIGFVG